MLDRVGMKRTGLQREPLVDHQCVALVSIVEVEQPAGAFRTVEPGQHHQRALPIGHIVRAVVLPRRKTGCGGRIAGSGIG